MKNLLIVIFLISSLPAEGQIRNFKIGININQAIIPTVSKEALQPKIPAYVGYSSYLIDVASIAQHFNESPGLDMKALFEIPLSSEFYITSGLTVSYLRFQQETKVQLSTNAAGNGTLAGVTIINGIPVGSSFGTVFPSRPLLTDSEKDQIGKTNAFYVHVPALAGTNFFKDRLSLSIGGVASFMAYASSYSSDLDSVEKHSATDNFTTVLAGMMLQASYNLTSALSIDLSGQHYFNPLYKSEYQLGGKAKMSLLSAGVGYRF